VASKTKEATMTPRKASLRVAHQRDCPNASKTALDSVGRGSGCNCWPSFYTFMRGRDGRPIKGPRLKDRRVAERSLTALQFEIDEGRAGRKRVKDVSVSEWADEFERICESRVRAGDLKPRTLEGYRETLALARLTIGDVLLREVGPANLRSFYELFEKQKPASRLRHLRQLAACFSAAVDEGLLPVNPLTLFTKKLKLKSPRRGKAPFEDAELERLWTALRAYEAVYLFVCRLSVETGARLGELVALDWENVDLSNARLRVEYTWDDEVGQVPPKDREPRTVYLTRQAQAVLEKWVGVVSKHTDGPVFENPIGGGRLNSRMVQRRLATAMEDAGIPKEHPELRLPRSFHSLRYTTSVLMQRRGYHPRLIESNLGHGTLELTYSVYGGWTPEQLAAEASRPVE
jgi:integrase